MPSSAYIALGSNMGDRLDNLVKSLDLLFTEPGIKLLACSSIYETEPVGGPAQGPFLNACLLAETGLTPVKLLKQMLAVEDKMKRVRFQRWGPRIIDLDLLVYADVVMNTPFLQLPHPRLTERDFVLIPLVEIAADLVIPGKSKSAGQILAELKTNNRVNLFCPPGWFLP